MKIGRAHDKLPPYGYPDMKKVDYSRTCSQQGEGNGTGAGKRGENPVSLLCCRHCRVALLRLPFPVILFNSDYWKGFLDWLQSPVLARGFISEEDLNSLRVCDHPDEVTEAVQGWYIRQEVVGRKALLQQR